MAASSDPRFGLALISSLESRASALRRFVERLSGSAYPSEGPELLRKFLSDSTAAVLKRLEELRPCSFSDIEVEALRLGQLLAILHLLLEYVAHAKPGDVPGPMVPALEAIVRSHVEKATVIVRFTWQFNYTIQDIGPNLRLLTERAPFLGHLRTSLPDCLPVVSFPIAAKDDTLLHAAFGHEIGHFVGRTRKIEEQIKPITIDPGQLLAVQKFASGDTIFRSILSWFRELIADVIGIHLFGPSSLLAFAQVTLHALNEPGLDHPPPAMRLQLMLQVMRELGYLDDPKKADDKQEGSPETQRGLPEDFRRVFINWEEFLANQATAIRDPFYSLVTGSANAAVPIIKERVREALANHTYLPEKHVPDIEELSARLGRLVPPDDINGRTPDLITILNAGWRVAVTRMDQLHSLLNAKSEVDKSRVLQKVNDLVAKAIENSLIRRIWQRARRAVMETGN